MRQEFAVVMLNSNGKATINQNDINEWMLGVKVSQSALIHHHVQTTKRVSGMQNKRLLVDFQP